MRFKDLIGIALLSVVLFPITLLGVLLATGVVHLKLGMNEQAKTEINSYLRRYHPEQDRAEARQMKSLKALESKEEVLQTEGENLRREQERLDVLRLENAQLKKEILSHRKKIENLVEQSSDLQKKRLVALAEVYSSMRPEEAAPILLSLNDQLVADIIRLIPETRSQSKILGTLGALDVKRAAQISKLIGIPFPKDT